jgi:hypothetical protein
MTMLEQNGVLELYWEFFVVLTGGYCLECQPGPSQDGLGTK